VMVALLTLLGLLVSAAVQEPEPASFSVAIRQRSHTWLEINPTAINVGTFYGGATVHVEGAIPVGYDVAVACVGKAETVELKKKGRVLGILWMNVGDVVFENVPSVYLLSTSKKLAELAPPPVLQELQVGYAVLESRATRSLEYGDERESFGELLKLKESERLYLYDEVGVRLGSEDGGTVPISAQCFLPAKAPSGEYEVRLIVFKEGRGELLHVARLQVNPVGATAFISSLAQRHGLLYGVLAVLIALIFGLLTGFVFGLSAKAGH
jgi:uncharacterized protein (TIGR02186 family)